MNKVPRIEMSTGSAGFSAAVGIAVRLIKITW